MRYNEIVNEFGERRDILRAIGAAGIAGGLYGLSNKDNKQDNKPEEKKVSLSAEEIRKIQYDEVIEMSRGVDFREPTFGGLSVEDRKNRVMLLAIKSGMRTPVDLSYFMTVCDIMSDGFTRFSAFGNAKYFTDTYDIVSPNAGASEKAVAEFDNKIPGDGIRYRGRTPLQIKGRKNYTLVSRASGNDIVDNPDILNKDIDLSINASIVFWKAYILPASAKLATSKSNKTLDQPLERILQLAAGPRTGKQRASAERIFNNYLAYYKNNLKTIIANMK